MSAQVDYNLQLQPRAGIWQRYHMVFMVYIGILTMLDLVVHLVIIYFWLLIIRTCTQSDVGVLSIVSYTCFILG